MKQRRWLILSLVLLLSLILTPAAGAVDTKAAPQPQETGEMSEGHFVVRVYYDDAADLVLLKDFDLVELHDAFTISDIQTYGDVGLASYGKGYLFGYRDLTGLMQWLGARSYGIYLIHLPVFKFTHEAATRYLQTSDQAYSLAIVPFLLLFASVLILVLAELNFRYVEEPLRRIGAERAKRKLAALQAADPTEQESVIQPLLEKHKLSV